MIKFNNYDELYPDLVLQIIYYFNLKNKKYEKSAKSIEKFCIEYEKNKSLIIESLNPEIIYNICEKLCKEKILYIIERKEPLYMQNDYYSNINQEEWEKNKEINLYFYNSIVYGIQYIYKKMQNEVLPIECTYENQRKGIGTCFRLKEYLITAKHCLKDPESISIKGYTKEELDASEIYMSSEDDIDLDLAMIKLKSIKNNNAITIENAMVLEDILVFGYPSLPGFESFLIAEPANISSKGELNPFVTKGKIVGNNKSILTKTELMLITAKIKGGNSGGPVVNMKGQVVGVASNDILISEEYSQGNYDNLGYGICVPIKKYIEGIPIYNGKIKFTDFNS